MFNSTIFAFDFDGTLVKNTKFIDPQTNDKHFNEFKLFVNPSAFDVNWTIVTSRPIVDRIKIEMVLDKCNAKPTYPIMTQIYDIPKVKCDEEYQIKVDHFISLVDMYHPSAVVYIDNSQKVLSKITECYNKPENKKRFNNSYLLCYTLDQFLNCVVPKIGDLK